MPYLLLYLNISSGLLFSVNLMAVSGIIAAIVVNNFGSTLALWSG